MWMLWIIKWIPLLACTFLIGHGGVSRFSAAKEKDALHGTLADYNAERLLWQLRNLRTQGLKLAGNLDRPSQWTVLQRGAFTSDFGAMIPKEKRRSTSR